MNNVRPSKIVSMHLIADAHEDLMTEVREWVEGDLAQWLRCTDGSDFRKMMRTFKTATVGQKCAWMHELAKVGKKGLVSILSA